MPVVGTAGHVDHGKSTLVRALTGRDPDRWEEEKRRGLTIDLGFAWTEIEGRQVGFVDVPGHERFVKNMLAGVGGIDAALFVVAADEGWMPQSEEHLSALDLIGVSRGLVALTRADLADDDTIELATLEVSERIEGTSLEGVPIIPVAAPEGRGLEEVLAALAEALPSVEEPGDRPRLWVDRAFSVAGAGTVVTGTLTGGSIAVDDGLVVHPGAVPARVRGLQSYETKLEVAHPTNRVAVNLGGVERAQITRGAMLGRDGDWQSARRLLTQLRTVRTLTSALKERGAYQAHIGSGAYPARLTLLEAGELKGQGAAIITLDRPVPVAAGDAVILREVGRRAVVGGGRILDPAPARRRHRVLDSLPALRDSGSPDEFADALLAARGAAPEAEVHAHSAGGTPSRALVAGAMLIATPHGEALAAAAHRLVSGYHEENPLRAGMPKETLRGRLRLDPAALDAVVGLTPELEGRGDVVAAADFEVDLGDGSGAWQDARAALVTAGLAPPRRDELGLGTETLHALLRSADLVDVSGDFVYLPETLGSLKERVADLDDGFTVADFRTAMGITRKHAVPLLEWLDREGITRREGDGRVVRR